MRMLNKKLDEIEFVIFDIETTGLEPFSGDRIIEIAAKRFKGLKVAGNFHSLVNPGRPVSYAAYLINHITDSMLKGAPNSNAVLGKFYEFISGSCLLGYNVNFDLGFLNNELKSINKALGADFPIADILKMSRALLPRLGRYSLLNVSQFLNIDNEQEHRAKEDVELTFRVFQKFLKVLLEKGIEDFSNFLHLFGVNTALHSFLSRVRLAQIQEALDSG